MKCAASVIRVSVLLVCLAGVNACNNCEKLVEKVCTDLGPEDCAYWKQQGGDEKLIPGGRKVNRVCGQMTDDVVYQPLLKGQRDMIKAYRAADAAKAKAGIK